MKVAAKPLCAPLDIWRPRPTSQALKYVKGARTPLPEVDLGDRHLLGLGQHQHLAAASCEAVADEMH
jgi:hypothetical protein